MNETTSHKIRIAAIGDLHFHENYKGIYSDLFSGISKFADILLLCGDLTNTGTPLEAENLAREIAGCKIPVLAVFGNHDHHSGKIEELKKILRAARIILLDEEETFVYKGLGFAGVKGFGGGFDSHIVGSFGETAIKNFVAEGVAEALKLENALTSLQTEKKIVLLHYSPIAETIEGEPREIFAFLGCSRLAESIDRFGVSAAFHGHAHHGKPQGKTFKGIPVYNCAYEIMKKVNPQQPFALVEI